MSQTPNVIDTPATMMFSQRDVPWGKLGAKLDKPVDSSAKAIEMVGLGFNVVKVLAGYRLGDDQAAPAEDQAPADGLTDEDISELQAAVNGAPNAEALRKYGRRVPELLAYIETLRAGTTQWRSVNQRYALIHEDTHDFFAYVSKGYVPVQFREAFSFIDGINPSIVAAGKLHGGRQGFMVCQLPEHLSVDLDIDGEADPHELYVILRTSHDLSRALEAAVMMLRGRCMNALTLSSFTSMAAQRWSIRHVGDPMGKLQKAQETIARTEQYVEVFQRNAQRLAGVSVDAELATEVLERVLPKRPRRPDQIAAIKNSFKSSDTIGFHGTGWALVQAVTEYFEHGRESGVRTPESRFTSPLNGATHNYGNRTAQLLLQRAS